MTKIAILLVTLTGIVGCASDEDLAQINQSATTSEHDWSYDGPRGPRRWSEIDTKNEACGHVGTQSPINLSSSTPLANLPDITHQYADSKVDVHNNGHTIQYQIDPGSTLRVGERIYELLQFHFHAHSEHAVDGNFAPLELHLVHRDQHGNYLVEGVFIHEGAENETLARAGWDALPLDEGEAHRDASKRFALSRLTPGGPTFRYAGSLTTPPCTEAVSWVIYERPITMSRAQIETFLEAYDRDYRPLQPLGTRPLAHGE